MGGRKNRRMALKSITICKKNRNKNIKMAGRKKNENGIGQ